MHLDYSILLDYILLLFSKIGSLLTILGISLILLGFAPVAMNPDNDCILFYVDRSASEDKVYYELVLNDSGNLNQEEPIRVYWIRNTENGQKEPLLWIQRKFGYGLKYIRKTSDSAEFRFAAFKDRLLTLKKNWEGKYMVYTTVNGKEVIVNKLYVQANGGTIMMPNIEKVALYGTMVATGNPVVENIRGE